MVIIVVQLLHLVTLLQKHIDIIFSPLSSGQVLQKDQGVLVAHFFQLGGKLQKESRADVAMEL